MNRLPGASVRSCWFWRKRPASQKVKEKRSGRFNHNTHERTLAREHKTMNWIPHPTILQGQKVQLLPLHPSHFEEICLLANDASIWKYYPTDVDGTDKEKMLMSLNRKLEKRESGEFYPFTIIEKSSGHIAGCTMFWNLNPEHRSLEIGSTWYPPRYWGSGLNTECKYLMLAYSFEQLKTIRVQIKALDTNIRSRKAIEKTGFQYEGILRNDKILSDGSFRNAAYYSIIENEWPAVKAKLEQMIKV